MTTARSKKGAAPAPLTAAAIRDIVGRISDDRIAAILATGATHAQVVEAFSWLSSDEYLGAGLERPLSGVVADVYEILKPEEAEEMDRPPSA